MSQLALALEAGISAKHVSFLESGRSSPSREMLMLLADQLDVPLRERNALLLAAGFAPLFPQRSLEDPALQPARRAVDLVLQGHEPYPALAIDRHWHLVAANRMIAPLLANVDPSLLAAPVNVLRLSVHPRGLASRIVNLDQWRQHLFARLRQQIHLTADPALSRLLDELRAYPVPRDRIDDRDARRSADRRADAPDAGPDVVVPLQLRHGAQVLSFISTTTIFGTPVDVTLSELAIESFFPADEATGEALRQMLAALPAAARTAASVAA